MLFGEENDRNGAMLTLETGEQNSHLRSICKKVEKFDDALVKLVAEMEETMLEEDPETGIRGVGLAANQIGVEKRIMLISLNVGTKKDQKVVPMINPEVIAVSPQKVVMEEGCLSLPGVFGDVVRPARIHVRWQDLKGAWREKKFGQWDARVFLREINTRNPIRSTSGIAPTKRFIQNFDPDVSIISISV